MDHTISDAHTLAPSPLTGTNINVRIVHSIATAQIIRGYKLRLGIDVATIFGETKNIRLLYDAVTGLSFFDPPTPGDVAFYSALACSPRYHREDKAEFRIAASHVQTGSRVLEVGAGVGYFTKHLPPSDYLGLEFNVAAAATARALGIRVVERDVLDVLCEEPEGYDVTCAFQVLEHVPQPRSMIIAMAGLTRPGGKIILATPNAGSYISHCRDLLNVPPHHVTWWEDRTWRWIADEFGLLGPEINHTPIDEMLPVWAQMLASDGVARQLGLSLDPIVDESPLRDRIDQLAAPVARTILAGLRHRGDIPEAGHTTVAVFTKPSLPNKGTSRART